MGIQARNVHELAASVPEARYVGERNVTVNDIVYDSRHVRPGALFVCWKGATADGHSFAREAVAKGARALFCERYLDELAHVPQIVVPNVRERLGELASAFYGHPSRRLTLIGVTGTNRERRAPICCIRFSNGLTVQPGLSAPWAAASAIATCRATGPRPRHRTSSVS